jgi:hypothetical protein
MVRQTQIVGSQNWSELPTAGRAEAVRE